MKNLIIALLIGFTLNLSANWAEVTTPATQDLNKIQIINDLAFCVGNGGIILKSTDFGDTWNSLTSGTVSNLNCIVFVNSTLGFIGTADGKVLKTTNGGNSWSSSTLQTLGGINGIDFLDENTGVAVGDNGNVFHTTNGGANWINLGSQSIYVVNDVAFVNDTLAVAVGAQGSIISSSDAGATWEVRTLNVTNTFSAITKKNNSTAAFVGTGGVYSTFSATSLTATNPTKIDVNGDWLKDIHIINYNGYERTFATGVSSSINLTNPGWKTWDLDSVNNVNGIGFFDDTLGIACGLNGKIYKTLSAGMPVSQQEIEKVQIKLYPNPTSDIVYLPSNLIGLKLVLYTSNGRIVKSEQITNSTIDLSNLNSGLYFIKVLSDTRIYSARVIKQ